MNIEVQEAIEQIRDDVKWNSNEYLVDVVVSYISKLQKEIEQEKEVTKHFKEETDTYFKMYLREKEKNKTLEKALAVANRLEIEIKKNFISKDKIKDKIKEFEYKLTHDISATEETIIVYENILATLESLLEGE